MAPGRGAWAETMDPGLEGKGQVVGQRGDDLSDAKPHTQHAGGAGLSRWCNVKFGSMGAYCWSLWRPTAVAIKVRSVSKCGQ